MCKSKYSVAIQKYPFDTFKYIWGFWYLSVQIWEPIKLIKRIKHSKEGLGARNFEVKIWSKNISVTRRFLVQNDSMNIPTKFWDFLRISKMFFKVQHPLNTSLKNKRGFGNELRGILVFSTLFLAIFSLFMMYLQEQNTFRGFHILKEILEYRKMFEEKS